MLGFQQFINAPELCLVHAEMTLLFYIFANLCHLLME